MKKIGTLKTPTINQNGYHKNILTKERIGTLFIYPTDYTPDDCLSCDGYSLLIIDYEDLYKVIGKQFNQENDPENTFRIPDYNITGRFLQPNGNVGVQIDAGLPSHKHFEFSSAVNGTSSDNKTTQQLRNDMQVNSLWYSGYAAYVLARTNSNADVGLSSNPTSTTIYGKSSTVQPPSQTVHICIKYK